MPVYFVAQVDVQDADAYARYSKAAAATFAGADVKVLAVDDAPRVIEGTWHGPRTLILEFPSEEALRSWYDSPAYQEAKKLREGAIDANSAIVSGLG